MHPIEWASTSPVFQNIKHSYSKIHFANLNFNPFQKKSYDRQRCMDWSCGCHSTRSDYR